MIHPRDWENMSSSNKKSADFYKIVSTDEPTSNSPNVIQISTVGVITISITIIIAAISATWILSNKFGDINEHIVSLNKDIEKVTTDVSKINDDVSEMNNDISEINTYLYEDDGVKDQLGTINEALNLKVINIPDGDDYSSIKKTVVEVTMEEMGAPAPIIPTSVIGLYENGDPCYAKDVVNEPVLLTYTEGLYKVYFYGTYNDNYIWDGYCITNVYYSDGSLYSICESNFDNGKRLDYRSFYLSDVADEWIYSQRVCTDNANVGTTTIYALKYGNIKNFTDTNVRISDILYVDKFLETTKPTIISYYHGNTLNGKYNDDTETAYLIKYNSAGFIDVLYIGEFVNGEFNDTNAQEIVFDSSNGTNQYFLYEGAFINNKRQEDIPKDSYITQEEIDQIIKDANITIDYELKWYKEQEN